MRLMDSRTYRGNKIRVYLLLPNENAAGPDTYAARPALGVQVFCLQGSGNPTSTLIVRNWAVLPGITELDEALRWGRSIVDDELDKVS